MGQDEPSQDAVVDGLNGLLLLAGAVGLHAVEGFEDLEDLTLLLFVLGGGQHL